MSTNQTAQKIANITDEGLFESLATAVLREANSNYESLVHTGINAQGKTKKSPVDGICFVSGANPPRMILVHHTITASSGLEKKWLYDPSKTKSRRKNTKDSSPEGDLIKAAKIVAEERKRTPDLRTTLVLTTNQDPGDDIVRLTEDKARAEGIEIDLWSRSRLCAFLDNRPQGQWLRRRYLKIDQELLSPELLRELSKKNLELSCPSSDPATWVSRSFEATLKQRFYNNTTILVARSGLGKSVACYRLLSEHVKSGGFALIISHEILATSLTLEQAIIAALKQIHPFLDEINSDIWQICSKENPIVLAIEDLNLSEHQQAILDKLVRWQNQAQREESEASSSWRLFCPIWPEVLANLSEQSRKNIMPHVLAMEGFSDHEGQEAVLAITKRNRKQISSLRAQEISSALGNDPLLIALYEGSTSSEPLNIIGSFVENSLIRAAKDCKNYTAGDFHIILLALAKEMLTRRQLSLSWVDICRWEISKYHMGLLACIAKRGEIIRLVGSPNDQRMLFRHDRVRNYLLSNAVAELHRDGALQDDIISDPYYAEIIGEAIISPHVDECFLNKIQSVNPLALFYAFRLICGTDHKLNKILLDKINEWLANPKAHSEENASLRWVVQAILSETDSSEVPSITRKFKDVSTYGMQALLRNGDLSGGINLCANLEPGVDASWRNIQIENAKFRYGKKLTQVLKAFLERNNLASSSLSGALRLSGHIADQELAPAIQLCWDRDKTRNELLADYLWAFAECCGDNPTCYLEQVCDEWAALPDQTDEKTGTSLRANLAANQIRWAFRKWPPTNALNYFIERAKQDEALRWPITYMLHGIDHPSVLNFVVQQLAAYQEMAEGKGSFCPFVLSAQDDWRRAQEERGRNMSATSRNMLLALWQNEENEKFLRQQSFSLWAATIEENDLEILRQARKENVLGDKILMARLRRKDVLAIPELLKKIETDEHGYWWQAGRYIWSDELTHALDSSFEKRRSNTDCIWFKSSNLDHIQQEILSRLSESEAERLLLKHWNHLRFSPLYVQTALYFATPNLLELAQATINECPEPPKLMEHFHFNWGMRKKGRPSVSRQDQIRALTPYFDLLSSSDINELAKICNEHGWFALRQELLDNLLSASYRPLKWNSAWAETEIEKMIEDKRIHWIRHWLDDCLQTGVSVSEILSTLEAWFERKKSISALQVFAATISHIGTRSDLAKLKFNTGMSATITENIVSNTQFEVRRRTLC